MNDLSGRMRKNNRAAHAARFSVLFVRVVCQSFKVLTTTPGGSTISSILCLSMKTIRFKLAKVLFTYFVQREQLGIIAKHVT